MIGEMRANRRIVFQGMGSLGIAVALAGCGNGSTGGETPATESGAVLTTTGDVPVGGGVILSEERVVVTQPTEGEFKAFSAVCTHQSCVVNNVDDGVIGCNCHGSRFDAGTGEVLGGPAPSPLPEVSITVEGDQILTA